VAGCVHGETICGFEFAGALYHATARGYRQEPIFEDDTDRHAFLNVVVMGIEDFNWVCHAYCLGQSPSFAGRDIQAKLTERTADINIPRAQRRGPAPSLARIAKAHPDRKPGYSRGARYGRTTMRRSRNTSRRTPRPRGGLCEPAGMSADALPA
jgi:hypothetical protein